MAKIISIDEHFQHFPTDLKESFWGDLEARTRLCLEAVPGGGVGTDAQSVYGLQSTNAARGRRPVIATAITRGTL